MTDLTTDDMNTLAVLAGFMKGTLYRNGIMETLGRLVDAEFVKKVRIGGLETYEVTDAGRREVQQFMAPGAFVRSASSVDLIDELVRRHGTVPCPTRMDMMAGVFEMALVPVGKDSTAKVIFEKEYLEEETSRRVLRITLDVDVSHDAGVSAHNITDGLMIALNATTIEGDPATPVQSPTPAIHFTDFRAVSAEWSK